MKSKKEQIFLEREEGFQMEIDFMREHIRHLQKQISDAHKILDKLNAPSNGKGGKGKRSTLSLSKRIDALINRKKYE